jgi:hypothetical protein
MIYRIRTVHVLYITRMVYNYLPCSDFWNTSSDLHATFKCYSKGNRGVRLFFLPLSYRRRWPRIISRFLWTFAAFSVNRDYCTPRVSDVETDNSREKINPPVKMECHGIVWPVNNKIRLFSLLHKKYALHFLFSTAINLQPSQPVLYPVFKKLLMTGWSKEPYCRRRRQQRRHFISSLVISCSLYLTCK